MSNTIFALLAIGSFSIPHDFKKLRKIMSELKKMNFSQYLVFKNVVLKLLDCGIALDTRALQN